MTFYHVCFSVPDLGRAMEDLTAVSAVRWHDPVDGRIGDWPYRIAFTVQGPPFIELIEAAPGGPWGDTTRAQFHHIGFWTSDITAGASRLAAHGFPEVFSGCPHGRPFAYHRMDSVGGHVELVDAVQQPSFLESWHPGGPMMPVIHEESTP
ncbi:VOC family protein [Streptomyces sp. BE230]|uniref:VOC family protein n=1 Tax=Streptomyces sp. BE230 TaxID=3002526 RepID=UPI002ED0FE7E|nr:VOC family protein [Streptomyces sp. BE230]